MQEEQGETRMAIADVLTGTGKRSSPDRAPLLIALGVIDDSHTSFLFPRYPLLGDTSSPFPILQHELNFEYPVSHLQIIYIK